MNYFFWHYGAGLVGLGVLVNRFFLFLFRFFNVAILVRTLFSPWKRDITFKTWRGFSPTRFFQKIIDNLFARIMGTLVRSVVIVIGLTVIFFFSLFSFVIFPLWIVLPFAFPLSLFMLLSFPSWIVFSCALLFFFFMVCELSCFRIARRPSYASLSFQQLHGLQWFSRAYERVGLNQDIVQKSGALTDVHIFETLLEKQRVSLDEWKRIVAWEISRRVELETSGYFWLPENLDRIRPIGYDWDFAYTVKLDRFSLDLSRSDPTEYRRSVFVGREKDFELFLTTLSRSDQNNCILVGEPGIGKMSLVHNLARDIREQKFIGTVFARKRILLFHIADAIAFAENNGKSVEGFLGELFSEATYAGNIILVIEDISRFITAKAGEKSVNITSVLADFLQLPTFQIIGTAFPSDFHDSVSRNHTIMKSCEKIILEEMTPQESLLVLFRRAGVEENRGRVFFSFQSLRAAIEFSGRYNMEVPLPERATDLLVEAMISCGGRGERTYITEEDIVNFVSKKTGIPLGKPTDEERGKFLVFESILQERIVGQEEAVRQVSEAVRKIRSGIADPSKPIASFLFLGPTGVGKTEMAKALAEAYFGSESRMIRLDMSEFQGASSLSMFIGSKEQNSRGRLIGAVKDYPHSLLLLDEIEKSDARVLDLLLQVLDEGFITDVFGEKVFFRSMIIIATSNAGSLLLSTLAKNQVSHEIMFSELVREITGSGVFRIEFLNRFSHVILFKPLSDEELFHVTELLLHRISAKLLKEKNITLSFADGFAKIVVEKGYDAMFGARSLKRFVEDHVEDVIARKLLSLELRDGQSFLFRVEDLEG